jgi:hypothetical protein
MPRSGSLPARVLLMQSGASGSSYRETEVEGPTSKPTSNLMSDQFNVPVRVVAINTMERWSKDVSAGVDAEIQTRCDIDGEPVPEHVKHRVDARSTRQLALLWV